ncbi:RING/U-box superfamily protein [Actinidia rufa]|uniref:RING/U-box superfamily protein n=1 Tax=Actinidia rufa TaxID=165716 RepID=A0A7J0FF88_9ERIC|nr:RING/U-box superfamily protein [Actinidia rufa]
MVCGNTFSRTICSICYEDLKPIVEDLQSISICGHVFHELCLQQWFEYCSNAKKKSCPVCKQTCSEVNVSRLYFQSVGDQNLSQKFVNCKEDPEELQREIERLERKVSGLSSDLELYKKDVKELSEKLRWSQAQADQEATLKTEVIQQKAFIQKSFDNKSKELDEKILECKRLNEMNKALAKELAELTLASDLSLVKEKILKLDSLGNEANNKGNRDYLADLLALRNKSYIELMTKYKDLAPSLDKLKKKKKEIKELKARIKELEIAVEVKDNEVLRALRATKKTSREGEPAGQNNNLGQNGRSTTRDLFTSRKLEKLKPSKDASLTNTKDDRSTNALGKSIDSYILVDANASEVSTVMHQFLPDPKPQINENLAVQKNCSSKTESATDTKSVVHRPYNKDWVSGLMSGSKCDTNPTLSAAMDEDTVLLLDDIKQVQSFINADKETPCQVPISQPGDLCFVGGLLGPDGTKRHLGKWCKRVQGNEPASSSAAMQGSSGSTGNLIAVGADGRGGKIKDSGATSTLAKRCKYGAKTSTSQPRGGLQIEHFFGRQGQ